MECEAQTAPSSFIPEKAQSGITGCCRFPCDCVQVDVLEALSSDIQKNKSLQKVWLQSRRESPEVSQTTEAVTTFLEDVKSETVIMSSLHLFLPAGRGGETVGHFTHSLLHTRRSVV